MGLSKQIIDDIKYLLDFFETSQWNHSPEFERLEGLPILTRQDLMNLKQETQYYQTKSSGSTGEPVTVNKTYADWVWYLATNIREFRWRGWDITKNIAMINARNEPHMQTGWGIPYEIESNQGNSYFIGLEPISVIQKWLEEVNPHYIQVSSNIIKQIDLSKITNYIDHKGSNEVGDSMYSSEECGTIAITCPDNPSVYHVMENQLVEVDDDGAMVITCKTNPYIKRYKHGDHIELGTCHCGRTLQTITKINGRVRNMFHMKNGDIKWPLIGSRTYGDYGIKRYKCFQVDLDTVEVHVVADKIEKEEDFIGLVKEWLDQDIEVKIVYVDGFNDYKHEEFVTLVKK